MPLQQKADSRKSRTIVVPAEVAEKNAQLLHALQRDLPITAINGFASLVNFLPTADQPIRGWFRYREGFSVDLVKKLIGGLPRGSVVLDPFCGSGSTLLAAQELGFQSVGLDVNPLSVLVSKVKTRTYSEADRRALEALQVAAKAVNRDSQADNAPSLSIIDKIFHPEILHATLVLRRFIKSVSKESQREFLLVAWLAILESVSNVYKEGNGIKYRNRKRLPDGYITISDKTWQRHSFPKDKFAFVLSRFDEQLGKMIADLGSRTSEPPVATVYESPAETLASQLPENCIAYAVFSPPYCNCFNYFKMYKVELWMGEFVKSYKDMQALNRRAMRSHVETVLTRPGDKKISAVEQFVELIEPEQLWDKRIPNAVRGYFQDMREVLRQVFRVLKPSGECTIVVGNSAYAGILVPTDTLLARIAGDLGFEVQKFSVARHLTTSSQQQTALADRHAFLRETLVTLKKPDPRLTDKNLTLVDELPVKVDDTKGRVFLIRNGGLTRLTHKFHRYPGKFIPHIPRWAIRRHLQGSAGKVVVDPFCGSGTTLVEAMLAGHTAYGIDIDPLARLVSKVKTTALDSLRLSECVGDVLRSIRSRKSARFKPVVPTLNHWFGDRAVFELGVIRDVIDDHIAEPDIYRFLLVCFIAVIRRASNADNQTQKTYVSHTKKKTPPSAKDLFAEVLVDYAARAQQFAAEVHGAGNGFVFPGIEVRNLGATWNANKLPPIDLVITSPPYLKSVDYISNQMAEYFWVGDLFGLETQPKQNEYKRLYLGSQKVGSQEYRQLLKTGIPSVDRVVGNVFRKDQKNARIVARFFSDMYAHLAEIREFMRPDSNYVIVVGDSVVSGEPIPVHELMQDCAARAGFSVSDVFGYEIRNRHMRFPRQGRGGLVRYDWVIDLHRGGPTCQSRSTGGQPGTTS